MNIGSRIDKLEASIGRREDAVDNEAQGRHVRAVLGQNDLRSRLRAVLDDVYTEEGGDDPDEALVVTADRHVSKLERAMEADAQVRAEVEDIYRLAVQGVMR